jgi:hypothetical protein
MGRPIGASEFSASARRDSLSVTSIRSEKWHNHNKGGLKGVLAHWLIGHPPKYPTERGEPQDILDRLPGVTNDNQLVWPLIPFPEDWCGT